MTSFGVEWDTNVLVFLPDKKLPEGTVIKVPFYRNRENTVTMTLETWQPKREDGCLVSLEVQFGPFESKDEKQFSIEEYRKSCGRFVEVWKRIINSKKVQIGENYYDILIYSKNGKFLDCAKTITKRGVGYTDEFFLENTAGTPQMTIGVELKYIISIFSNTSLLYNQSDPNLTLLTIFQAYSITGYYCADNGIRDLNIISFLILIVYYILCLFVHKGDRKQTYEKAYFGFKIRTNYRIIYESIGSPEKEVREYLDYLEQYDNNMIEIIRIFRHDLFNPIKGYSIQEYSIQGYSKLLLSPLTIVNNNPKGNFKSVNVFPSWARNLPDVIEKEGTISFKQSPSFDFGEWTIGKNNMIYIEIRFIIELLNTIYKSNINYNVNIERLCADVIPFIEKFLNECLNVNPTIIIPSY